MCSLKPSVGRVRLCVAGRGKGGQRRGGEGGPGDMDATSKARWPNVQTTKSRLDQRDLCSHASSRRTFPAHKAEAMSRRSWAQHRFNVGGPNSARRLARYPSASEPRLLTVSGNGSRLKWDLISRNSRRNEVGLNLIHARWCNLQRATSECGVPVRPGPIA